MEIQRRKHLIAALAILVTRGNEGMAEEKEVPASKSRIESLSDLIFGLALSIGALTLIGHAPSSFQGLLVSVTFYAFSFLILISVWYSYTRTMSHLRIETSNTVYSNIALLFLVSIEPFLFNELFDVNLPTGSVSIVYAFDIAGLFIIQGLLANCIVADKNRPTQLLLSFTIVRNSQFTAAAFFLFSALPIFWTWGIQISTSFIPLRVLIWIIPLLLRSITRTWEEQVKKAV